MVVVFRDFQPLLRIRYRHTCAILFFYRQTVQNVMRKKVSHIYSVSCNMDPSCIAYTWHTVNLSSGYRVPWLNTRHWLMFGTSVTKSFRVGQLCSKNIHPNMHLWRGGIVSSKCGNMILLSFNLVAGKRCQDCVKFTRIRKSTYVWCPGTYLCSFLAHFAYVWWLQYLGGLHACVSIRH